MKAIVCTKYGPPIVEHPWSGLRYVWVKEGMEVAWEKIRPSGFHVRKLAVDCGAHHRLALDVAAAGQRL